MILALAVQFGQMLLVLALAPAVTGIIRKMKARLQRRVGPPIIPPHGCSGQPLT
jgi:formate hydrogenlyase subunit 4